VESIAVTKLDVLDESAEIKVCTEYELEGQRIDQVPLDLSELSHVKPIYKSLPGWQSPTTGVTDFAGLPPKAQDYLNFIAEDLGVKICLVSTGAKRQQTIMCHA
jgi:adenylosuccinate synthase